MRDIFYVSGLPRSGSTLLMNILGQHPDVHVTPTSGCHEVLWTTRNNWPTFQEHRADEVASSEYNLQRVLSSILQSYHDTKKLTIFDKHRSWIHSLELIEFIERKKCKVIVPVRSIVQILSSFEKLYRKHAHLRKPPGDFISTQTTEGRCNHWASNVGELGIAYNRLKDAFQRGYSDRLMLVEYEALTRQPEYTLSRIWDWVGLKAPRHDFSNVVQITRENDDVLGMDYHTIRPTVEYNEDDSITILGEAVVDKYKYSEFWRR